MANKVGAARKGEKSTKNQDKGMGASPKVQGGSSESRIGRALAETAAMNKSGDIPKGQKSTKDQDKGVVEAVEPLRRAPPHPLQWARRRGRSGAASRRRRWPVRCPVSSRPPTRRASASTCWRSGSSSSIPTRRAALRWLAVGVLAYAVSPIDLIPDFIPVLGMLDDVILVPLGLALVVRLTPADIWQQCLRDAETGGDALPRLIWGAVGIVAFWLVAGGLLAVAVWWLVR